METIKKIFQNSAVQIFIVVGGVAVTLVNMYIASRLAPISQRLDNIIVRVEAIEQRSTENLPLIPRFIVVEEKVNNIERIVTRIEDKVDELR